MSRFDLVPLDGGAPVHLPPGETLLGRGPLLGISDKRVSRFHAVLDVVSGRLRLKSSSLDDDPRPLDKDCWVSLSPGDFLSLLPGRFVYRVAAVGGAADTLRDVPASDEEEPSGSGPGQNPEKSRFVDEERSAAGTSGEADKTTQMSPQEGATSRPLLSACKKRVLPAWMMKATSPQTSSPIAVKKRKEPVTVAKKTMPTTSPVEAGLSEEEEEERPRKKSRISDDPDSPKTVSSKTLRNDEVECERRDVTVKEEEEEEGWAVVIDRRTGPESANGACRTTTAAQVSASKPAAAAASAPRLRTPCPYGSSCYRKNPAHFQESSHPGDSDFEEEEVDEAQLPECPYGTNCYRKNPLHRKEFSHTRRPARSSRTVSRNPADKDDDDEEEYESSFIDDSDDGDADEDYVPAGSDDDREDAKRLQREARDFLKKRK